MSVQTSEVLAADSGILWQKRRLETVNEHDK
jgi:hypothetical protein